MERVFDVSGGIGIPELAPFKKDGTQFIDGADAHDGLWGRVDQVSEYHVVR